MLKVAAVQYPLEEGVSAERLFDKIRTRVRDARAAGASLVIFPELITTELVDWNQHDHEQLTAIARDFTPKYFEFLKTLARDEGIAILGGSTPRVGTHGILNTAALALADGRFFTQDKLFLTPDEKEWGWVGGDTLNVIETPWGRTVISICFDTEFPGVSDLLVVEKPDLILVPSWTSTQSGLNRVDWTSRARAVEHFAYVVKTGTVAPVPAGANPHWGQASIHTPQEQGFPVEPLNGEMNVDQILYGTLDLAFLRAKKAASGYYPGNEQRLRVRPIKVHKQ